MSRKSRAVAAVAVQEYLPKITRGLPVGSTLVCADNSGARVLKLIQVVGLKTRHRRIPAARVGDLVVVSV
ncbi:uL14 family ribosomal protein, partial [archaeon]|nr:uL14 family ribosomal protein [archaeon]